MTGGKPPWRRGRTGPGGEVPEIPLEEVQRRVDGREGIAPREPPRDPWIGGRDDLAPRPERSVTLAPARGAGPIPDPRRLLWRDSATILVFVVIALLVAQAFPPGGTGTPVSTEVPSGVVTGSLPPGFSLPPGVTFGPIVDPSLGIDATPTPIPAITEAPTSTPGPNSTPPPSPKASPKPTPKPPKTPPPSNAVTPPPTPEITPEITPTPAPSAAFDCTASVGNQLSCVDSSSGLIGGWLWDWGDGNQDTGSSPPTHTYDVLYVTVTVRLTVTGPGGSDFLDKQFVLVP